MKSLNLDVTRVSPHCLHFHYGKGDLTWLMTALVVWDCLAHHLGFKGKAGSMPVFLEPHSCLLAVTCYYMCISEDWNQSGQFVGWAWKNCCIIVHVVSHHFPQE